MAKRRTCFLDAKGEEFSTLAEAQRSDELLEACQRFEEARMLVCQALGKGALTGDGIPFSGLQSGFYWHVKRFLRGRPFMRRVWVWPHDAELSPSCGTIKLRIVESDHPGRDKIDEILIVDLFVERASAVARMRELLAEFKAEIDAEFESL